MATATEKSDTAKKAPELDQVRLRYLGDKHIVHTLTGLEFTKHVMHTLTRDEAADLLHWSAGEEFEEIK